MNPISRALYQARLNAGLTRAYVAAKLGIKPVTLAAYELGESKFPAKLHLHKLPQAIRNEVIAALIDDHYRIIHELSELAKRE